MKIFGIFILWNEGTAWKQDARCSAAAIMTAATSVAKTEKERPMRGNSTLDRMKLDRAPEGVADFIVTAFEGDPTAVEGANPASGSVAPVISSSFSESSAGFEAMAGIIALAQGEIEKNCKIRAI
jgi:hypothetical protein